MDNIQVGDLVTIRSWDDMADEFGLKDGRNIRIKSDGIWFAAEMKKYCEQTYEVGELWVNKMGHLRIKLIGEGVDEWNFSRHMLESEAVTEIQVDESDFMAILNA